MKNLILDPWSFLHDSQKVPPVNFFFFLWLPPMWTLETYFMDMGNIPPGEGTAAINQKNTLLCQQCSARRLQ